jgi:plasmid stabilization system protein ParE
VKPVRIAPQASEEFTEAVRWYEGRRTGLGDEFYDSVVHAVSTLRRHPAIGVKVESPQPHRQVLVDGFPYRVIYRERSDDLYVVAVAHTSRRPGYWKHRG